MTILFAAYILISTIALIMTQAEASGKSNMHIGWRTLGLLACLVWPVTLAVMIVSIRRQAAIAHPAQRRTTLRTSLAS